MVSNQPRRHWCFLAEIVDIASILRLQMEINDIDGKKVPPFFYANGRGSELAPAQVKRGYSVAILCAQSHEFMFDEPGIRHENPRMINVST